MLKRKRPLRVAWVLLLLFGALSPAQAARPAQAPQAKGDQDYETARRGLDLLMDGDPDAAIQVFHTIQTNDPESPLGDLLVADALWWKIYFASANLLNPDVFDVATSETTPYNSEFDSLIDSVVRKAQTRVNSRQDAATNELYLGMAYGLQARLEGMRGHDLPAARAGKKMRAMLLKALQDDPNLNDAYLGVGIYNYFVDTLPGIVKVIRWLIGLPGGSREEGLRQIERAATHGDLSRSEAKFYLAKDFSRDYEKQYTKSLKLFQELAQAYPHNSLWKILTGSLEIRLGRVQRGETLYREALKESSGLKTEAGMAIHRAAKQALLQQHPNEPFGD